MPLPDRREFERRRAPRRACPHEPLLQLVPKASFQPLEGRVKDVSATGVGLLCDEGFPVGTVLALQWPLGGGDAKTVLAHVAHATPQDDGSILVGCQFDSALSPAELDALTGTPTETAHRIRRAVLSAEFLASVRQTKPIGEQP